MESNSTLYQAYRRNPGLRQQLECQARELRSAEMDRLVFAPLAAWIRRHFTATPRRTPSFQA
jgi:hypothetical protein